MATLALTSPVLNKTNQRTIPDAKLPELADALNVPKEDGDGNPYTNEERFDMLSNKIFQWLGGQMESYRRRKVTVDISDVITD